ncbi:rhodopsin [Chelmon rostratus]|uniref:rhodopsin n=1 Tax=Chelmon rostratus TaxID=109905 RepID=UPI001BEA1CE2|nr:rhodopsin [Chelmon rostratus]
MDAEELIESIIRALMFLAGILGNNWLAFRSLLAQKSGIRTNEVLFINLAVSNLITNYLVDLPDTMADFAGRWFLGETFCGVFRFCADLSETSSIYTTFFISAFWHQKLVGSLKRGGAPVRLDSLCLVGCLLAGSWTVAVVFSIPHFFFVTVEGGNDSHEDCIDVFPNAFARQTYEIFYLTLANAIPAAGIAFATVQIVITLLQNQRRIQGHQSDPTKEVVKNGINLGSRNDDRSDSTVSNPGPSKYLKESAAPTQVCSDVSASHCPTGGLSGHSSSSPPLNGETNTNSIAGAPPNLSKPSQMPAKPSPSSSSQVRAAKSVVAVASVFLVCWLTHLLLRITNSIHTSSIVVEVASYIAASYTCIIPYIFLHGVKRLSCSCKR